MKIIIDHSRAKREINGSFRVCGSAADLHNVARQILTSLDSDPGVSYGWMDIHEELPTATSSTSPVHWDSGVPPVQRKCGAFVLSANGTGCCELPWDHDGSHTWSAL